MKQQQITYDKGITYVPSDVLCSDNALSENVGLTYENGEMKPIQKASEFITSAVNGSTPMDDIPTFLYVHQLNDQERYIGHMMNGNEDDMCWGTVDEGVFSLGGLLEIGTSVYLTYTDGTRITSIGKTLIVNDDNGIRYYIWKENGYENLGTAFPKPEVEYYLGDRSTLRECSGNVTSSGVYYRDNEYHIDTNKQSDWNNTVIGIYTDLRKKIWQKKAFVGSFCVRAALELYDGSYYHVQNPVFMVNHFSAYCIDYLSGAHTDYVWSEIELFGQNLYYKFSQDYAKWSDIVRNVVLFVTKEANLFDTASDAILEDGSNSSHKNDYVSYFISGNAIYNDLATVGGSSPSGIVGDPYIVLKSNPDSDLEEVIKDGVYYKLCEIGLYGDGDWHLTGDHFDTHKIENITTQEQLVTDDWYSHCDINAGMMYSYNSRLNLAQVHRGLFEGFNNFMPFDNESANNYKFYVEIETDGGTITVEKSASTKQKQGIYFYYPDPRAKKVYIKKGDNYILNEDLTEHPTLNGAYYFAGVSKTMVEPGTITTPSPEPVPSADRFELLPNYIITSEVNNPFVFRPEGYFKVGTGKIIGCSTITQALSEGQFGQFPLLVFSESGIWALTVGSTGYYTSIHPISREVCSEASSITQTDGAVYFVSEKGLMVIVGNAVKCVSEQFDGKVFDNAAPFGFVLDGDFETYLKGCRIAYDYRDSQLVIINPSATFQWVYNMKSSTFSKAHLIEGAVGNILNDYPDSLLQASDGKVYSLLKKPDQNADNEDYDCVLLTRPMKLENGLALKTIMDMKNIGTMEGSLVVTIYGSNDCQHWMEVPSLTGIPWKYYRFKIVFSDMKATDRFSGTLLVTQERRTNKLR